MATLGKCRGCLIVIATLSRLFDVLVDVATGVATLELKSRLWSLCRDSTFDVMIFLN